MEQYRRVELFNANSEIYWNINKFVESQGFSNVVEYCAEILSKMGSVDWCTATVKEDMYNQSNRDLEFIYEDTIERLERNYKLCYIPCNGTLQDISTLDHIPWCDVIKLEIKDKTLEITTAYHGGRSTYVVYCMDSNSPMVEEFYNEKQENDYYDYEHGATLDNDKDIQEYINTYCLPMYDLFYEGKI
jgi:hypothetical protein|nr:MAG TPA: endoribonuclease [Caudoviricetes sp.]